MDDYGALAERYLKKKTEVPSEKLISVHIVHQKSHTDHPTYMNEKRIAYRGFD